MFSVFHTADWHLGQSLCGFDRHYEHAGFLSWLLDNIESRRPDVLLIAGDVFDSINPSAAAQKSWYEFLAESIRRHPALQVVVTAGNHDAAARLEAPSDLMAALRIHVVGTVQRNETDETDLQRMIVPLRDDRNQLRAVIAAVPFLRPADVPVVTDADDPYRAGMEQLYRELAAAARSVVTGESLAAGIPIIGTGHLHVQGGSETRDSERRLIVGGAEAMRAHLFPAEFTYVALGHLHRRQSFRGGTIRYSGSPIPLSFAETGYEHGVLHLKFDGDSLTDCDTLLVPRAVEMLSVPQSETALPLEDVVQELEALPADTTTDEQHKSFLEVRVRDDGPDPFRRARIEAALADKPVRLASIKLIADTTAASRGVQLDLFLHSAGLNAIEPEDIFVQAHQDRFGAEPDDAVLAAFREIVQQEAQPA
ncbi:MAG: exonuclease SbcCD subunit D C-terminal domain-containing protein [Planctomycetaceae bacterium]|nr:exonuclease SbcCD subunit D C-terminal domain-containing protein [Planctomycetaceae bacterium]